MTDEKVTADEIIAAMRVADAKKKSGKGGSASLPTPNVDPPNPAVDVSHDEDEPIEEWSSMDAIALRQAQDRNRPGGTDSHQVEVLSAKLHRIYQQEARRQGDVRHDDDYNALSENTKEYDRVLARYILRREANLIQRLSPADTHPTDAERIERTLLKLNAIREESLREDASLVRIYAHAQEAVKALGPTWRPADSAPRGTDAMGVVDEGQEA